MIKTTTSGILIGVVAATTSLGLLSSPASATSSATLSIFAGNGSSGTPTAGAATSSPFRGPAAVAFDASENLYVADPNANVVTKITPSGTQSIFAGTGSGGAPTAGPATSSRLRQPQGLAFDASGNLYIADSGNNKVEKVTPSGALSIFAGTGSGGAPTAGPALSSSMAEPEAVAVDASNNVYVAIYDTYQVVKITPAGTLSIFIGNGSDGAPTAGPALSSPTGGSFGLTFDTTGNLYMTDYDFCVITKTTPAGVLSIYGGNGTCGTESAGPATSSPLGYLYGGLSFDFQGNLYFADSSHNTVGKISKTGVLSTVAGVSGVSGVPSIGPALSSHFDNPYAVAVDAQGNLYVADESNLYIEKIVILTPPSAPTSPTAAMENGNVVVNWMAPVFGDAATSYTITPIINGVATTPITGVTALNYTLTNPAAGATYSFTVTAVNANGNSPASTPSNSVSSSSPPSSGISAPIHIAADGTVTTVPVANSPDPATQITASTPTGDGSWTLAPDGGVFAAGDANFYGSHGGSPMNASAVGIAPTANAGGYLVVGADGGVFAYGNAAFQGSMGGRPLNAPVTGVAMTCSNNGYYLVAGDGGVFGFGDAGFYGSMAGRPLNQSMTGIVDSCGQHGYWTFAKDGGVFTFGNAGFYGSLASNPLAGGVIGMVSAPDGEGYWLIGANQHAYGFGSVAN